MRVNWFLYFVYGLTSIVLFMLSSAFESPKLMSLASILEDAQFIGLRRAWRKEY